MTIAIAIAGVAAVILIVVAALKFKSIIQQSPSFTASVGTTQVELYKMYAWDIRRIPRSTAFIALTDETGWLGYATAKYLSARMDYEVKRTAQPKLEVAIGDAVVVPVKRLPVKSIVIANIYNENKITNQQLLENAIAKAIDTITNNQKATIIIPDPTDDWNYYQKRAEPELAAKLLITAIAKHGHKLTAARIIVSKNKNFDAYKRILATVSEERWKYAELVKQSN